MADDGFSLTAISRAMTILAAFDHSTKLSLADLSRATGLSEATALRYATSLTTHNMLERDPESGRYGLGMRLFLLGENALRGRDPRGTALPHMHRLRERFEETVNLAMRNGDELILVEVLESPRSIRMGANLGERDEWSSSALGKAILAHIGESEARALLERASPPGFDPSPVLDELDTVRTAGYSVDNEESQPDLRCVGAPIFERGGVPRFALSVSGPVTRITVESVPTIGAGLREAADTISATLGHLPSLRERQLPRQAQLVANP
jgi:IclR family acetate operon transcriptional repressor